MIDSSSFTPIPFSTTFDRASGRVLPLNSRAEATTTVARNGSNDGSRETLPSTDPACGTIRRNAAKTADLTWSFVVSRNVDHSPVCRTGGGDLFLS